MGLEELLLHMFREDFDFHDDAGASHHGAQATARVMESDPVQTVSIDNVIWLADAEKELRKIPFFVRGKARRNTESYATQKGLNEISKDTLYEAKAHFAR